MSLQINKYRARRASKKRKNTNIQNEKNNINPDILNIIKNAQNTDDNPKSKIKSSSKKLINTSSNISETINIIKEDKINSGENELEIKLGAKKGLLYFLNNLSKGTFCPDIEEYFKKMKDIRIEQLKKQTTMKHKNSINNYSSIKEENSEEEKQKNNLRKKARFVTKVQVNEKKQQQSNANNKLSKSANIKKIYKNKKSDKYNNSKMNNLKSVEKSNIKETIDANND